jgi:hypothetical protein
MKRSPLAKLGAAAVTAVAVAVICQVARRPAKVPPAEAARSAVPGGSAGDETAALRAEVARLAGQVAALRRPGPDVHLEVGGSPAPAAASTGPRAEAEAQARWEQGRREYIAGVEAAFRKEPGDPSWASRSTRAIRAALEGEAVGLTARELECRSRTCRLELSDDGTGKLAKAVPVFANSLAADLPNILADQREEPGGGTTTILYLTGRAVEASN